MCDEWRAAERSLKLKRQDSFLRNALSWFADYPFAPRSGKGSSEVLIPVEGQHAGVTGTFLGALKVVYVIRCARGIHLVSIRSERAASCWSQRNKKKRTIAVWTKIITSRVGRKLPFLLFRQCSSKI